MNKTLALLPLLLLTGCAGVVCNDGYQEDLFGSCSGHAGVDLKTTFPDSSIDSVEMMAVTAYEEFHDTTKIDTGFLNLYHSETGLKNEQADCDVHAKWVEDKLAEQGIYGDMVIAPTEFGTHAAFMASDGRIIDINLKYTLTIGEWLEMTHRM